MGKNVRNLSPEKFQFLASYGFYFNIFLEKKEKVRE